MEINWQEENIGKNLCVHIPPSAQEIIDRIDEVEESQKDEELQRIFFGVADPSSKRAYAEYAKGQVKWELEKQKSAFANGISVPCRISIELQQKMLSIYLDGNDPFKDKKEVHRMKRPVHYSHLIRVLCFINTQLMVGKMMTKHQGRTIGLSEKAIRDYRDKSEASLKIPPELEERLYRVAFAVYYWLASTHRLSLYLGNKKKPLK